VDRVAQLYQSLDDCLRVLGTPLPAANASHLARVTLDWLQAIYERRQERAVEGGGEGRAERTDYWIWVDTEKQEEAAENEAVAGMTRALDRVVKTNPASLGNMGQVAQALNKIHAAACFPPEDEE
jgi:hypothetical protein